MWSFVIGLIVGLVAGFGLAVPYWWRRMKALHYQWLMFCDQMVNEKIAEFFGGRVENGAIIVPVNVVKPAKPDGEVN